MPISLTLIITMALLQRKIWKQTFPENEKSTLFAWLKLTH
jgi:hypothetical protein